MPPNREDDEVLAADDDNDLSASLRTALDCFYGQQNDDSLANDLRTVASQVHNASVEQTKAPIGTKLAEDDATPDVSCDVQYFLEAHEVADDDDEGECKSRAMCNAETCASRAAYAQLHRDAVKRTTNLVARLLASSSDDDDGEADDVADQTEDLVPAIAALLQALAEAVPLCVFRDLVHKLLVLDALDALVSLVIAMAPLVETSPDAVVNITERCAADLWLLYVRWFTIVERLTGDFPWFGTNSGFVFWMALRAVCPTTASEVELLSLLETLAEPYRKQQGDSSAEAPPPFTLAHLASLLNFVNGPAKTPFEAADLPRLSRQTRRWRRMDHACAAVRLCLDPLKRNDAGFPEFTLAQALYYIEHVEALVALDGAWGNAFVAVWAEHVAQCSAHAAVSDVLKRMCECLRQIVGHCDLVSAPEARRDLEQMDPLIGPTVVVRAKRSIADLSVDEVVESLRAAQSLSPDQLDRVEMLASSTFNARGQDVPTSNTSLAALIRLDRMVQTVYKFALYPVQLVAVVCATCGDRVTATRLATVLQMETGEGKSVVFAVIAAFFALQGKSVDVATSSGQLATDGDRDAAAFFDALKISHSVRMEVSSSNGELECYASCVVYGTVSEFAGDYLRQLIFGDDGRGTRPFGVLLLDEVDAALVDGAGNLTMLSMTVPGMDRLYFMYGAILRSVKRTMELENDRMAMPHYTDAGIRSMLGLPALAGSEAQPVEIESDSAETSAIAASAPPTPLEEPLQVIPKCLLSVCDKKLQVYIEHAWGTQTWCQCGRQYDVQDDDVVVIDSKTSGEYQRQSVYSEGLHQFLQIEHGCRLTPESLNSVFLSNGALARRYTTVVGITGTIGSVHDQQAMSTALDNPTTQFAALPRSKQRQYVQLPPLVLSNAAAWRACWLHEIERCVRDQRPVLLIFADKEAACREAEYIEKQTAQTVQRYIINDAEWQTFSASSHKLEAGEIVVSTSYGGRGTDYKLSVDAETNGGLHTVLTFYASSIRVIEQAFGRSARAGSPGSGVLVTLDTTLASDDLFARRTEEQVTRAREYTDSLSEQLKMNVPLNESCDKLFERFAAFHAKMRDMLRNRAADRSHFLSAVRDRFGLLIEELRHDVAAAIAIDASCNTRAWIEEHATTQYKTWCLAVAADFKSGHRIITNERAMVVYARDLAMNHVAQALEVVERAIATDAAFAGPAAYVLRLKCTLERRTVVEKKRFKPRDEADYTLVRRLLVEAQDAFSTEIEFVGAQQALLVQDTASTSALNAQLTETMNLLFILRDTMAKALAVLNAEYEKRGKGEDDDKFYLSFEFVDFPDDIGASAKKIFKETLHPNGYLGPLQLEVKREWMWDWNAFGAVMLGLGQAIGGALAMVFSAGVYGMGLITEGISDIVSGIVDVIKGDGSFSWSEYFTSKALSLAVSFVCWGVCKVGKAIWRAGKALAQRSVTFTKSAWKNGLRATLKSSQQVTANVAAQQTVKEVTRTTIVVSRSAFKHGLTKCGTDLGSHVTKQALISGLNFAADEGIRAAFRALETTIDNLVQQKIGAWVDGVYGHKMERLHHMFLHDKRGISAVRLIGERSKTVLGLQQQQSKHIMLLEQFGRMLADDMAVRLAEGLKKNQHCLLALCVKGLTEGLKWAEVSVHVAQFVDAYLDIAAREIDDEVEHLVCIDVTAAASGLAQWNTLEDKDTSETFVVHASSNRVHWRPASRASVDALAASTTLAAKASNARFLLSDATTKLQIDSEFQARGVAWTSLRRLLIVDLSSVATTFIRSKLERRTSEFSKRLAAFGARKLVDSVVNMRLQRKADKLRDHEPSSAAEGAEHDTRIERFLADNVVARRVQTVLRDVRGDGAASHAVLHALARHDGVAVVIHHANGEKTVLNGSASGEPMHFDESGAGKLRHLVPSATSGAREPFEDTTAAGDKACLYRAYLFHKLGRNGTDDEVSRVRDGIAGGLESNPKAQLDLYNQRMSKRSYGAKGKGPTKGSKKEQQKAKEEKEARAEAARVAAAARADNDALPGAFKHKMKHNLQQTSNSYFIIGAKDPDLRKKVNFQRHLMYMVQFVTSRKGRALSNDSRKRVLDFAFSVGYDANAKKLTGRVHYDFNHGHPNVHLPNSLSDANIPTMSKQQFCTYIREHQVDYNKFIGRLSNERDLQNAESQVQALELFETHVKK